MQPGGYGRPADADRLDATFAALADPTRRAILTRLASGEASVTELAAPFAMSQPAISKHQRRPCRVNVESVAEATSWLEHYREVLEANFQRLDALLDELQADRKKRPRTKRHTKR
jgi:hypothetical protein